MNNQDIYHQQSPLDNIITIVEQMEKENLIQDILIETDKNWMHISGNFLEK